MREVVVKTVVVVDGVEVATFKITDYSESIQQQIDDELIEDNVWEIVETIRDDYEIGEC